MPKTTVTAYQKYIRQTPRKLRLVADMVRPLSVREALTQLDFSPQRAAGVIKKVLTQAQANAVNNLNLDPTTLKIDQLIIEDGPIYKRWQPVSRGRAHGIQKKTSHIKIVVSGQAQSANTKKGS